MAAKRGKYSRAQARARIRRTKRRRGSLGWTVATSAIVVAGVVGIVLARAGTDSGAAPRVNQDHWHAYLGVNVCGEWLPNAPQFESAMGIHSHGDGLMHIHPYSSAAAGKNATVGRFVKDNEGANWSLSASSMRLWDGAQHSDGQKCSSGAAAGKPAKIIWSVGHFGKPWTGKLRSGNPADYRPQNGDIVAIGFLPSGASLSEPPEAQSALANISDIGGGPANPGVATTPGATTSGGATSGGATPGASTPAASGPAASSPPAGTP